MRAQTSSTLWMSAVAALLGSGSVGADTVTTFADPAIDGSTPLFERSGDTLSGGWSNTGLDLITPISGDVFPDAVFSMTDLTVGPGGALSAGVIEFHDFAPGGVLLLRIEFDSALLFEPFGFGASEMSGQNVIFSGAIISAPLVEQSFAFGFANPVTTPAGATWTASFTSSAIPEPSVVCLLALGAAAVCARRRM